MLKEVQSANLMTFTESESKRADYPGPVLADDKMVTNNFDIGFDDDLNAIFGVSVGFVKIASITPTKFIYGLDEFEGAFKKDLETFFNSTFVGVTSILPAEYGEI